MRRPRLEVADIRAEQQHHDSPPGGPLGRHAAQTDLEGGPVADERHVREAAQRTVRQLERRRGDVDQMDLYRSAHMLQGCRQTGELLTAAAAELDKGGRIRKRRDDGGRMTLDQLMFRTGDAIPGKPADGLEEQGAQRVVQILRVDLLWPKRQRSPHILGELP